MSGNSTVCVGGHGKDEISAGRRTGISNPTIVIPNFGNVCPPNNRNS